jgi:hypothetical protein
MPESNAIEVAQPGDAIAGADLQTGIDQLKAMADALNPFLANPDASVDDVQAIGRTQADLRSKATALVVAQIDLVAGEAKITAEQINGAVAYSDGIIAKIADWRRRLDKIGALISFLATIPGGHGNEILQAAHTLKSSLDA